MSSEPAPAAVDRWASGAVPTITVARPTQMESDLHVDDVDDDAAAAAANIILADSGGNDFWSSTHLDFGGISCPSLFVPSLVPPSLPSPL